MMAVSVLVRMKGYLILSVVLALLGSGFLFAAPALAAQETPEVSAVEDTTAVVATPSTEALLHGVVNPVGTGEAGTYKFLYKKSITKVCTGESETTEGMILTPLREEPAQAISGLAAGTEYAVCLRVENNAKTESAISPAVTFTTAIKPETPEKVELVQAKGTSLKVRGVVNPNAAGEAGTFEFLYRRSGSECEGESASAPAPSAGLLGEEATGEITGLLPHTTYTFCLRARNVAGEESAVSTPPVSLTTLAVAPEVSEQAATQVTGDSAKLQALLNPGGAEATYTFQYGSGGEYGSSAPVPAAPAGAGITNVPVAVLIEGLTPATTYHYRLMASSECEPAAHPGVRCETPAPTARSRPRPPAAPRI